MSEWYAQMNAQIVIKNNFDTEWFYQLQESCGVDAHSQEFPGKEGEATRKRIFIKPGSKNNEIVLDWVNNISSISPRLKNTIKDNSDSLIVCLTVGVSNYEDKYLAIVFPGDFLYPTMNKAIK